MIFEKQKLRDLEAQIAELKAERDYLSSQISGLRQTGGQRKVSPLSSDQGFEPLGLSIRLCRKRINITERRLGGIVKVDTSEMVANRMTGKKCHYKRDVIEHVVDELKKNILKHPSGFIKTKHDDLTNQTYVVGEVYFLTPEDVGQERDLLLEGRTMEQERMYDHYALRNNAQAPHFQFDSKKFGAIGIDRKNV